MEYQSMRATEKTHVCAMCESELVTIWDSENNCHRLCCAKDRGHNGFQAKLTPSKALARGQLDKYAGKGAQTELEKRAKENSFAFSNLPKEDAGDFTPVTLGKVEALIKWADSVSLNAYLGHVELYFSEPRVSIDGYYYLNNKRAAPYQIGTMPMILRDKSDYQLDEGDYGSIARAYLDDKMLPEVGIGIVKAHELTAMSKKTPDRKRYPIVAEHPQRMAEKRAEWQLLRKLISLEVKE